MSIQLSRDQCLHLIWYNSAPTWGSLIGGILNLQAVIGQSSNVLFWDVLQNKLVELKQEKRTGIYRILKYYNSPKGDSDIMD